MTLRELFRLVEDTGRGLAGLPGRSRHWTRLRWVSWLGGLALITFAFAEKRAIQSALQGRGDWGARELASFIDRHADGASMMLLALLAYLAARLFRQARLQATAEVFLAAGFWALILWVVGKFVLAEARPIAGGELRWFALDGHGISGHAVVASLLILPVREVLLKARSPFARRAITSLVIGWVCIVGWSRMFLGKHFLWNILSGVAVGLWTSAAAVEAWRARTSKKSHPSHPVRA